MTVIVFPSPLGVIGLDKLFQVVWKNTILEGISLFPLNRWSTLEKSTEDSTSQPDVRGHVYPIKVTRQVHMKPHLCILYSFHLAIGLPQHYNIL